MTYDEDNKIDEAEFLEEQLEINDNNLEVTLNDFEEIDNLDSIEIINDKTKKDDSVSEIESLDEDIEVL